MQGMMNQRRHTRISIVVPCFNSAGSLAETLSSALNQTAKPCEIVVADDGSTDASAQVASSFGSSVKVVRQTNQGVSVARNTGFRGTSGDYVMFLDSDDLLSPNALAELSKAVERSPGSSAVMSYASFEDRPDEPSRTWNASTVTGFFPHLMQNCIAFPAAWLFPRRAILDVGGFDPEVRIYQFWHFLCKVALTRVGLVPVDFVGASYRQSPTSMIHSASLTQVARGQVHVQTLICREVLRSHPDLLQQHGEILFWSAWTAMHRARECNLPEAETAELIEAIGEIARRGPSRVRRMRFAQIIRVLGTPLAERIRSLVYSGR